MNPLWTLTTFFLLALKTYLDHGLASPVAGPLASLWIGLYTAPTNPVGPSSVLADISEADYGGYARQEVAWFAPFVTAGGVVRDKGGMLQFRPTDSVTPNTITGIFAADALSGGHLLAGAAIQGTPVTLTGPGSALFVVPELDLPAGQVYGGPVLNF